MTSTEAVKITTPSDREIAMTRVFDAPRKLVFEALITPALVQRWLLGPPGWSMPLCEMDVKVGGAYRWVWRNDSNGTEMGMGGVFREIVPHERLVATEKFDESWYPDEAIVTNSLVERGGKTTLTLSVLYETKEARDIAMKSGMEKGVSVSYDRLADILATTPSR